MAIDATTLQPIRAFQGLGSSGAGLLQPMYAYLEDAEVVAVGDIVIINGTTGLCLVDNLNPVAANIVGVALDAHTAASTATLEDFVLVAPALPGIMFEANIADDTGDADVAGFAFATIAYEGFQFNNANTGGQAVIDTGASSTPAASVLGPSRAQIRGQNLTAATVNPRVDFQFVDSVFITPPVS